MGSSSGLKSGIRRSAKANKSNTTIQIKGRNGQRMSFRKSRHVFVPVQDQFNTPTENAAKFLDSMLIARTNTACKRIYRSYAGIIHENLRQKEENRFIIHPFSAFRWYWDMVMVVTLITTLLVLPVEVAFFSNDGKRETQWIVINLIVDTIFMADIMLNFRTGYVNQATEEVVFGNKKIAVHYVKTWFIIDFISSFPFDYLYEVSLGETSPDGDTVLMTLRVLRLTKLLSLLRILRIARLLRYINELEEIMKIEGTIISIMHLIIVTIIFCHWNACVQYLIAFIEGFPDDSWVAKFDLLRVNVTMWEKYSFSLYRSIAHMLGMGYGQHTPPTTLTELWIGMLCYILGGSFYALFIAHISNLIMSMNLAGKKYEQKPQQGIVWKAYTNSMYRSLSCMLGLGYNAYGQPPIPRTELIFIVISYSLGRTLYAMFLVYLRYYVMELNKPGQGYLKMVSEVKEYMRFRKVPQPIQLRVLEFYDHMYQRKYFDEQSILFEPNMSPILRHEILMHNCRNLVLKVPFLKNATQEFLYDIICKLRFQVFFPEDVVIQAERKGVAMYFIEHGEVAVRLTSGLVVKTLTDGDYFGEIALLLDQKTSAFIVATEIADMYVLSRADFNEVLDEHQEMKSILQKEALMRLKESQLTEVPINVVEPQDVSD